jgi:hypothetical protein
MINIDGIKTNKDHLQTQQFVGILLFAEYPSTIVYSDIYSNPIIKEWVDCSDDGLIDRYFYYKTSLTLLKKFIDGSISHQDLIKNSVDGLLYFSDEIEGTENDSLELISYNQLSSDYKPSASYFFSYDNGVELDRISTFFQLSNLKIEDDVIKQSQQIAIEKKAEVLTLNFKQARGIRFGTINTEILADVLSKFDRFYKNLYFDIINGISRGDFLTNMKKSSSYDQEITTEVLAFFPGSYNIVLRPLTSQYDIYSKETGSNRVISTFFSLFERSNDLELLKDEYGAHSEFTINSYKDLLKTIFEIHQDIDFIWANPKEVKTLSKSINYNLANNIINNIINLSIISTDTFTKKGKFRAINCDTGHFVFYSLDEEQFSGYVDKSIIEGTERIIFIKEYEVKINREVIKEAGKIKPKISDTIFAFFENIENKFISLDQ